MTARRTARLMFVGTLLVALNACTVTSQVRTIMVNDRVVTKAGTNVQLLRGGAPVGLTPGTALEAGDEIITGPNAQAVLVLENGKVEIIVFENTTLRYSSIFLELGEIYVRVKGKVQDWIGVDSGYITATPKTTEFFVRVGPNDDYVCAVVEGRVTLTSKDNSWKPTTLMTRDLATARARSPVSQRPLDTTEYNRLVNRVNKVERIYRPGAAELVAPDVVGLQEPNAQRVLREHGFGRTNIVGVVTRKRPVGQVVAQSPESGKRIRPRAAVRLDVEVEPASVPYVVGATLDSARRSLSASDLKVGRVEERLEVGADSGIVRAQSVTARTEVVPGTAIDLVVSEKGAQVPPLNGLSIRAAESRLRKASLRLGDQTRRASTATVNTIIDQHPEPNDIVRVNSEVDVVLAMEQIRYCTVPNVDGLSPAEAANQLRSAGFSNVEIKGQGGYVWGQRPTDPGAGTRYPCNSKVTINTVVG